MLERRALGGETRRQGPELRVLKNLGGEKGVNPLGG